MESLDSVVANKYMHELLGEWLARDQVGGMHPSYSYDYIQDRVISAGVAAELTWNPIAKLASQYEHIVRIRLGIVGFRYEFLCDPELPPLQGQGVLDARFVESMEARVEAFKEVLRIGCRVDVETPKRQFSETVWLRNISGHGVHPTGLARNIAELLVFGQIIEAFGLVEGTFSGGKHHS